MKVDTILQGDVIEQMHTLPDESVSTIVTSPPYWGLRDYGMDGQLGLEPTLDEYLEHMLAVTAECKRVLRRDGVMWWNHGDCYLTKSGSGEIYGNLMPGYEKRTKASGLRSSNRFGSRPKCLANQNTRLLLRMLDEQGWIHRNTVIWHKPNSMPSSVKDRFSNTYEPVYMLVKSKRYWFDLDAVRVRHSENTHPCGKGGSFDVNSEAGTARRWGINGSQSLRGSRHHQYRLPAGKNPGDVFVIPTFPFPDAHFATFPPDLVKPMILSSCPEWVCTKCGKPRVRVTEKGAEVDTRCKGSRFDQGKTAARDGGDRTQPGERHLSTTLGWTRCDCDAPFDGGIVLDPFGGSGTVGMVAKQLNRHYILIDLNPDYCDMARKRIGEIPEHIPWDAPDVPTTKQLDKEPGEN